MKTVHKYVAKLNDVIPFQLRKDAEILRVDVQVGKDGIVCLWALIDMDEPEIVNRKIRIAGTGHPIEEKNLKYINTFTMLSGLLWFHAFEIIGE